MLYNVSQEWEYDSTLFGEYDNFDEAYDSFEYHCNQSPGDWFELSILPNDEMDEEFQILFTYKDGVETEGE